MINTVVVIEEGIGAFSLGFAAAGFQVTDAFVKDKRALDIYKNNIDGRIYEATLMELSPKEITDADIIAIDMMQMFPFRNSRRDLHQSTQFNKEPLKKVAEIIQQKNPLIFFLAMQKKCIKILRC